MTGVTARQAASPLERFWLQSLHPAIPASLIAICLGTLAFGSVYRWAYTPLAIACAACGAAGIADPRLRRDGLANSSLLVALIALAVAIALQLVPVPAAALKALTPAAPALLNNLDPMFASGMSRVHAVSIAPRDTAVALGLYAAFVLLAVGLYRLFSLCGARAFVEGLAIFGTLLALVGIIQRPASNGLVYGFWVPESGPGSPFGPFVNRNHFAGWMLMGLPLTLGLLFAGIQRGMPPDRQDWRDRVLWLSSENANRLVLLAGASVVMALSLVMTMSRSGITALALALLITGVAALRATGTSTKAITVGYLVLLVSLVVAWAGADAIVARFSETDWSEFNHRLGAWKDAWRMAGDFPLTGTGVNTYRAAALFYQSPGRDRFFAQAHNDYLQVIAEGGALIVIPAAIAVVLFARAVYARRTEGRGTTSWWLRTGAAAGLIAIALQESVEFSLQMPANAALFAAVCAIALHKTPAGPSLGLLGRRAMLRREVG